MCSSTFEPAAGLDVFFLDDPSLSELSGGDTDVGTTKEVKAPTSSHPECLRSYATGHALGRRRKCLAPVMAARAPELEIIEWIFDAQP
jgi:hypothetical protein